MAKNNIQGSRTITRRAKDGDKGNDGSQGAFSIQKDWIIGDTHHNTSEVVDFIYVRGDSGATSYWYKKVTLGINVASTPPQGGVTPYTISGVTYEKVSWLDTLAVKTFIAEEANVAGFIFKGGQLISVRGTVGGVAADYIGQDGFVPNLILDGTEGDVKITGTVNAINGTIAGWNISSGRIGKVQSSTGLPTTTGLSLYDSFIKFSDEDSSVFLGTNVLPASTGMVGMGRITNTNSNIRKIGMYFDMAGADTSFWDGSSNNIAMYIDRGVIAGAKFNGVNHDLGASGYTIGKETVVCIYTTANYTVRLPSYPEPWEFKWIFGVNNQNYTLSGNGKNIWSPYQGGSMSSLTFKSGMLVYTGQQWVIY